MIILKLQQNHESLHTNPLNNQPHLTNQIYPRNKDIFLIQANKNCIKMDAIDNTILVAYHLRISNS